MPVFPNENLMLAWSVVIIATLLAACTDLVARRIPNWLTGPLFIGGVGWALWTGGLTGLGLSILAAIIVALPYVLLFLFARGGAGDAKIMGGIGAWLGLEHGLVVLVAVAIAGIILAVGYAVLRRRSQEVTANLSWIAAGLLLPCTNRSRAGQRQSIASVDQSMLTMPYGLAVFIGVAMAALGVTLWGA